MAVNFNLPQIESPQVEGPLDQFQKVMALKNMLSQQALSQQLMQQRQQEMQERDLNIKQIQKNQNDARTMQEAVKMGAEVDPVTNLPTGKIDKTKTVGYLKDHDAADLIPHFLEGQAVMEQHIADTSKAQLAAHNEERAAWNELLGGIPDMTDPVKQNLAYASALKAGQDRGLNPKSHNLPAGYGDEAAAAIRRLPTPLQLEQAQKTEEQRQKTQAETTKNEDQDILGGLTQEQFAKNKENIPGYAARHPQMNVEDAKQGSTQRGLYGKEPQKPQVDDLTRWLDMKAAQKGKPLTPTESLAATKEFKTMGAAATFAINNPAGSDEQVKYLADQVEDNPLNWNMVSGNKKLADQVRSELAGRGRDVNRLTASTRQLGETADSIVPKLRKVVMSLDDPKFKEKLGPIAGRWQEFLVGKVGAKDPDFAALRATMSMLATGTMRAHVGARGGSGLIDRFDNLMDAGKMDPETLKASLTAVGDFLQGYSDRIHPRGENKTEGASSFVKPGGALEKLLKH